MRRITGVIAGFLVAFALSATAGEEKKPAAEAEAQKANPFKQAKIGDWAKYRLQSEVGGATTEIMLTMKITAKDEKDAVITTEAEIGGEKQETRESRIALDKPYEAVEAPPGGKVEKIAEGDEKIKIGEMEYACHWIQSQLTMENPAMKMKGGVKTMALPHSAARGHSENVQ